MYREILEKTIVQVEDGNSLADQLREHREIPALMTQLIATGEKTGKLAEILERLSKLGKKPPAAEEAPAALTPVQVLEQTGQQYEQIQKELKEIGGFLR